MRTPSRIAFVWFWLAAAWTVRAAPAEEELFPPAAHAEDLIDAARGLPEWGAAPVFFPPEPPPLPSLEVGVASGEWIRNRILRPPPELAGLTGEPFYPALSTLLAMNKLGDGSRQRVAEYHTAKLALQTELRTELLRLRDASPDVRREQLIAFARQQTPKIAALEETAESLRTRFIKIDYRWGELRTEWLGQDRHHPDSAELISDVMRAASYYESGLLPAQRRFLREIALEVPLVGDTVEEAVKKQPYMFFSPGLARIRLPDDLPAGLVKKIADYQERRSALKKELYDVVFHADVTWLSIVRGVQFHLTLSPQAAAIDRLEILAEEIRRELALVPPSRPMDRRWSIPVAITQRLGAMFEGQRALRTNSTEAIETIRRREPSLDISYAMESSALQFEVRARPAFFPAKTADAKRRAKATDLEMAAITAAHRRGLVTLARERAAVRTELAKLLGLNETADIDAALAAALREALEQESDGPYRAYYAAVFEPGLSPEQRRLLFDSAIEQLALPLPVGEYQPLQ